MQKVLLPLLLFLSLIPAVRGQADGPSRGPAQKFLGNLITGHRGTGIRPDTLFTRFFDQVTPENFGKHGQVERERDQYVWGHLDTIYAFARRNDLLFKHHAFVFDHGDYALRPWLQELPAAQIREEIEEWIRDFFARYPETAIVDVVNEALQSEVDERIRQALGGDAGHAWLKWVYAKARRYAPSGTQLLINEYAVLNDPDRISEYLQLVAALQAEGLIDGVGLQAHGIEALTAEMLRMRLDSIADLGLPIHITEYDLDIEDDDRQAAVLAEQFPVLWEHPQIAGITFWGYKEGQTWKESTALLRADGSATPAWKWLNNYLHPPLHEAASFPIGGAINVRELASDTALAKLARREFNSYTATNDFKMYRIGKRAGELDFSRADSTVAFVQEQGDRLFGHTLVWHLGLPDYVKAMDSTAATSFLREYIDTVVTRYRDDLDGWDVVNEAFTSRGGDYRPTYWYQTLGPDYIARAFRWAHAADPDAKLFYNDFNTERDTAKLHAMLQMVKDLQAREVPIHGIGFQMHIRTDTDEKAIAYALKRAAETGLLIHLSEVDIIFNRHDDTRGGGEQIVDEMTPELLDAQGRKYESLARLYRECVPADQRYGITFWDFTDKTTWINGFFNLKDWPTLFDEDYRPKPAYRGFVRGLKTDR